VACAILCALPAARAQGPAPTPPEVVALPSQPAAVEPERPAETAPQISAPPAAAPAAATAKPALNREDLEAFLDGLIPLQLQRSDSAGVVVAVVKDGVVLFSKGYGYADFEKKKPVSAEETLFRPGSISKLFTATAVMQLVEAGRLDLDRDVNDYLDFTIPKTYPEPVTLRR
jgi:CubicO group peptidase (beta-lactamase class C family)